MPWKKSKKQKHTITPDLILDLYKYAETMSEPKKIKTVDKIKIDGLTDSVNIKITDIEGNLVAEAQSNVNKRYNGFNLEIDGGTAFWNGKNLRNVNVSSGVYIIMLSDLDTYETKILKLMVVR